MRILFDQAAHDMRNKGNNALLQVAMEELSQYWPDASLEVITLAPNLLRIYFPNAYPVSPDGLHRIQGRFDKYKRFVPYPIWRLIFELREEMWHRWPALMTSQVRATIRALFPSRMSPGSNFETQTDVRKDHTAEVNQEAMPFLDAISGFDLVVACGGGYMCDSDKPLLLGVFDRLEAAIARGIPTVMVGQGVGPLQDPELLARAREILPAVDLILYRNQRIGLPLLHSLGVPPERIMLTGDDAIGMAYEARPSSWENGIGVSLRVAHYTQVEKRHIDVVRTVLHRAARDRKAQLIAVPISSAPHESDITYIKQILAGYNRTSIGWRKLDTPLDAIKRAGKCRVMVTGTYHGAIFALAQGVPVIGVAKSAEYFNKLSELADEFGLGCQVFRLDDEQLPDKLSTAIDNAWLSVKEIRPTLLAAAARQIEWQQAAYLHLYKLVASRLEKDGVLPNATSLVLPT